jgi:S1-C subfamily serine protease
MKPRALTSVAACVALAALAGCVEPPPSSAPSAPAPPAPAGVESAQTRLQLSVRDYTLRLRNLRCDGVVTGSGFAIDRRTVITNRHVVETGRRLEVETWDGRSLAVASVEQATGPDLAIVHLAQDAPAVAPKLAPHDPKVDTKLHLVGYPEGKQQQVNNGVVVRYVQDPAFDETGKVMEMSGNAIGGNSGGPIVDDAGRISGVVFAYETATGWIMGVPLSRLRTLLDGGARTRVVAPC